MGNTDFLISAKRNFDFSFLMLEKFITQCPDELWNEKNGGFVFWQQLLHAFAGIHYWMRLCCEEPSEPFPDKKVYPELDSDPLDLLTKNDLAEYKDKVKIVYESFFEDKNDEWLNTASIVYDKLKNIDIIFMQIRHVQYHVGHCNSILRDKNIPAVEWIEF